MFVVRSLSFVVCCCCSLAVACCWLVAVLCSLFADCLFVVVCC